MTYLKFKKSQSKHRVVFYALEAIGHINSLLTLADALKSRGHTTIFVTTYKLDMSDVLESRGHETYFCIEKRVNKEEDAAFTSEDERNKKLMAMMVKKFREGPLSSFKQTYGVDGALWKRLDDLEQNHHLIEAKIRSLEPSFLVVDHIVGVPCVTKICEKWARFFSALPTYLYSSINENFVAGLGLSMKDMTSEYKQIEIDTKLPIRRRLKGFFKANGLEDWPAMVDMSPTSPFINFYMGPNELGFEQEKTLIQLPDVWFKCEHMVRKEEGTFEIPDKLKNKAGKLIYFSLGTLVNADVPMITRLLNILKLSPNRFIISKGVSHREIILPDNMWGEKYVKQTLVLEKVDLFITHGGHNSIIESFYHGVPGMIVLPIFADQFDNAQRVQDMGYGIRLNAFECSQDELLGSIESLLNNSKLKQKMKSIGARLRSLDYADMAASKIEDLLAEQTDDPKACSDSKLL